MKDRGLPYRIALWFESTRRPGVVAALAALALYLPFLNDEFVVDDHRAMRVLREYHEGARAAPEAYRFLTGEVERNRQERAAGNFAWWMEDDLRYQHMRPIAEWLLYAQYTAFGANPLGYNVISLLLYVAGVWIVFRLFTVMGHDRRIAAWGALIFAFAACHALPVVFISAQGDVIALVCAAAALLSAERFTAQGGLHRLVGFIGLLAVGIGCKESMLPVAAAPVMFWWGNRREAGASRRTLIALGAASVFIGLWFHAYIRSGYGSNSSMMLDPLRAPWDYLSAAPVRALLLLLTWVIPVNPFLAELDPGLKAWEGRFALIGAAALAPIAVMFLRRYRRVRGVGAMTVFVLAFLPILVCTPPDDRVMILPSIGLAFLGAVWLTGGGTKEEGAVGGAPANVQAPFVIPVILFLILQPATAVVSSGLMRYMELEGQRRLRQMAEAFGRPPGAGDRIYLINNRHVVEGLFMQDRLRNMERGFPEAGAAILTEVPDPVITVVDERTILAEAPKKAMLASFLGRMGSTRIGRRYVGQSYGGAGFTATIARMDEGKVRAVEFRFDEPLGSLKQRFFMLDDDGDVRPWLPPSVGSGIPPPSANSLRDYSVLRLFLRFACLSWRR